MHITFGGDASSALSLALFAVREVGQHSSNTLGRANGSGLNHDTQLDNIVVHVLRPRLNNKDVLITDRHTCSNSSALRGMEGQIPALLYVVNKSPTNLDAGFLVAELLELRIRQRRAESFADEISQLWVRGACEDLGVAHHGVVSVEKPGRRKKKSSNKGRLSANRNRLLVSILGAVPSPHSFYCFLHG